MWLSKSECKRFTLLQVVTYFTITENNSRPIRQELLFININVILPINQTGIYTLDDVKLKNTMFFRHKHDIMLLRKYYELAK